MTTTTAAPTLFERAAGVFDGWTEPETGVRVLRVFPHNLPRVSGQWSTCYHQTSCFLDGGRRVLLRTRRQAIEGVPRASTVLDLTTGRAEEIVPPGHYLAEVWDQTQMALLGCREPDGSRVVLWDLQAGR
ncbi:hypothetical protein HQ590_02415 [bacterium]|nr:hypothetical protein [bacterium]